MIVNANMAIGALIRVVAGNESRVYQPVSVWNPDACNYTTMCVYQDNGKPSCGVGCGLFELGMPIELLIQMDGSGVQTAINSVAMPNGWFLTSFARQIFSGFQTMQDRNGFTWGEALERAKAVARNPNDFDKFGHWRF